MLASLAIHPSPSLSAFFHYQKRRGKWGRCPESRRKRDSGGPRSSRPGPRLPFPPWLRRRDAHAPDRSTVDRGGGDNIRRAAIGPAADLVAPGLRRTQQTAAICTPAPSSIWLLLTRSSTGASSTCPSASRPRGSASSSSWGASQAPRTGRQRDAVAAGRRCAAGPLGRWQRLVRHGLRRVSRSVITRPAPILLRPRGKRARIRRRPFPREGAGRRGGAAAQP